MPENWFWLTLLSALGFAAAYVATKPLVDVLPVHIYLLLCAGFSLCLFASVTLWKGGLSSLTQVGITHWPWMVLLLLGLVVGNVASSLAIRASNPTWVSLIELSGPLFVIGLSWMLLNSTFLTLSTLIGGALMMLGAGVIVIGS